ncbi:MAG TPA: response regulator [Phycisphaerae bacterium]|nr:response regulator [Phycisphaerales bacterium]HRX84043.1 response regulator [Phycisphaerae bacterium]
MSLRVLVAEDHHRLAELCVEFLSALGHNPVGPVPSMAKARALLAAGEVDAGCLDVRLLDGFVFPLAEEFRQRQIPFVFCTGFGEDDVFPAEFRDVPRLEKPYSQSEMGEALQRLFDA